MYNFEGTKLQTQIIRPYRNPHWSKKLLRKPHKLLYFHGFAEGFIAKIDYLQALAQKGWEIHCINLPGHGASEMPETLSWEWLAEIYESYIKAYNLQKASWLAYSLGGALIQKLIERNNYVSHNIILIAPYLPTNINSSDGVAIIDGFRKHVKEIGGNFDFDDYTQGSNLMWKYRNLFATSPVEGKINFPQTTVLMLENDPVFPPKLIRKYFEEKENIQLQLLRGFTHETNNIPIEYKQVLIQHILQALS